VSGGPELQAVIFDFFGTVARHPHGVATQYAAVLASHGYHLDDAVESAHFARYNGIEHLEHSSDQATYEAWARVRLGELALASGVSPERLEGVVDDLRALDGTPVMAYPDAAPTLLELRSRGYRLAICSNWGWEIEPSLDQAGLLDLVDVAVTSARVGARKPHPRIFSSVTGPLGVEPAAALFVGDSLGPDVTGPLAVGMAAAHLWRPEDHGSGPPPRLPTGGVRIRTLHELLAWPTLMRAPTRDGLDAANPRAPTGPSRPSK
jgi:putative hydrolase of the HAD superfamily